MPYCYSLLLLLLFYSCSSKTEQSDEGDTIDSVVTISMDTIRPTDLVIEEDVYDIPTIKTLFVTNQKGADIFTAQEEASLIGQLPYGRPIEIIDSMDITYVIKEHVNHSYSRNGNEYVYYGWQKVLIDKADVGDIGGVYVSKEYLQRTIIDKDNQTHVEIEVASPMSNFDDQASFVVNESETLQLDSVLKVVLLSGDTAEFVGNPSDEESAVSYSYVGHLEFFDAFLVMEGYWENWAVFGRNNVTGDSLFSLSSYPHLNPARNLLFCFRMNPYDDRTEYEIYRIGLDKQLTTFDEGYFPGIFPNHEERSYWENDSTLLIEVQHIQNYLMTTNRGIDWPTQLLRIKIE